ncbi:MAG: aminotransferase class V-fold PLP-dependent enzyme [Deltaproteobacteria bacterium]|jgi:cysteine desulfurase family protein|nr:aminotransferase class V-fold PLP-dependent enzyme [Deltaproteobacteria bacterium]
MIYLDNAATSFPKPSAVAAAMAEALSVPASPGRSGHALALNASRTIHRARKALSKLFGLKDNSRLIFSPNVTWALNSAIGGLALGAGDHVISGPLEHNSTARPLSRLVAEKGVFWETVPLIEGLLRPEAFKKLLKPQTKLVVLNQASNVSGDLAPAREIKEAIGDIPLLLDTAQTAGAIDLEGAAEWVDFLAFTGHKGLLGPTGTGGLIVKDGINLRPLAVGGSGSRSESLSHPDFLPDSLEAGTANTHGLAGLAASVEYLLKTGVDKIRAEEMELTNYFLESLLSIPELAILGQKPGQGPRVATISVNLKSWSSSDLAAALEKDFGIMIRSGLHCAPMAHKTLGSFPGGASRFSIGPFNSKDDLKEAIRALRLLAKKKKS